MNINILFPKKKSTLIEALSRDGLTNPSDELSNFWSSEFVETEVIDK